MARILLVEDDEGISHTLKLFLSHQGHSFHRVPSAEEARTYLQDFSPDLILLDWMLPGQNGVSFARVLRTHVEWANIPIIMLTARSTEYDRIAGLEAGADDYLCKPFSMKELQARIQALLRRVHRSENQEIVPPASVVTLGVLEIIPAQHEAQYSLNGVKKKLDLSDLEFRLLHYLAKAKRVVSRQELLDQVWGTEKIVEERTVDTTIKRLRQSMHKIDVLPRLESVRGVGYKLQAPNEL